MKYYQIRNTVTNFITHQDNELAHVAGYPADIWVTENEAWAQKVGAIEKTKEEAQALVDAELAGKVVPEGLPNAGESVSILLP